MVFVMSFIVARARKERHEHRPRINGLRPPRVKERQMTSVSYDVTTGVFSYSAAAQLECSYEAVHTGGSGVAIAGSAGSI